jgi:hypothetical protein
MAHYKVLVLSNCQAGREAEYNDYYDSIHIPDVMREMPEVQSAQRFQVEPIMRVDGSPEWRFSCLYTVQTDDFPLYLQRMHTAFTTGKIPPSDAAIVGTGAAFKLIPLGDPITRTE